MIIEFLGIRDCSTGEIKQFVRNKIAYFPLTDSTKESAMAVGPVKGPKRCIVRKKYIREFDLKKLL